MFNMSKQKLIEVIEMSFLFLKCIDTYINDVSIAFSLNTAMKRSHILHLPGVLIKNIYLQYKYQKPTHYIVQLFSQDLCQEQVDFGLSN